MWALDVVPKIKYFLWRLLHGILPASINLVSRFVDVGLICWRCGREIETAEHVFRDCEWSSAFWGTSPNPALATASVAPLHVWFWDMMREMDNAEDAQKFCGKALSHEDIRKLSAKHWEDYTTANCRRASVRTGQALDTRRPPGPGLVKLNTDASVRGERGTGLAGVLRDSAGAVRWAFAERSAQVWSIDAAEATVVYRGM
ncbi:hypothetical protein ACS0TY_008453 [Phlomoides rotata]